MVIVDNSSWSKSSGVAVGAGSTACHTSSVGRPTQAEHEAELRPSFASGRMATRKPLKACD
eukprot:361850-Prymnesium_polylepis.1